VLAVAAVLVAAAVTDGVILTSGTKRATTLDAQASTTTTARVEQGDLSATVFQYGTLTYRARSDGLPYSVINQARGTYTKLPDPGDLVECGDVFYRVDDKPVVLLCGATPSYRDLDIGAVGNDVRQLNQNLHALGYDAGVDIDPNDNAFTAKTKAALEVLQHDEGFVMSGALHLGEAVFLPETVRIAAVTARLGASAQPGAEIAQTTSSTLEVQMSLDPSQQGDVKTGDPVRITLPGNRPLTGKVDRLGRVAQILGQNASPREQVADATITAFISIDDAASAQGLDKAPVQVEITTGGVKNALSVPVTALVGKTGGGLAVEVVRTDGRRELVTVKLGVFDAARARVQVDGELHAGDAVVVPSS